MSPYVSYHKFITAAPVKNDSSASAQYFRGKSELDKLNTINPFVSTASKLVLACTTMPRLL